MALVTVATGDGVVIEQFDAAQDWGDLSKVFPVQIMVDQIARAVAQANKIEQADQAPTFVL